MSAQPPREWSAILVDAVTRPGVIATAYREFWNYSVGNQLLALYQCRERGITPGPIHSFMGWMRLGRSVKKGEKAIILCRPLICTRPLRDEAEAEPETYTRFGYRGTWFVLSQTEGADYIPADLPGWQEDRVLAVLQIKRTRFEALDGNIQGYAKVGTVSVSPIAFQPYRTLLHELAHVVLGHTVEQAKLVDGNERTPRDIREVEAESVALLCSEALGLPGAEFSRGYIQHWLNGQQAIPERSAQRIFKVADQILRAGRADRSSIDREAA